MEIKETSLIGPTVGVHWSVSHFRFQVEIEALGLSHQRLGMPLYFRGKTRAWPRAKTRVETRSKWFFVSGSFHARKERFFRVDAKEEAKEKRAKEEVMKTRKRRRPVGNGGDRFSVTEFYRVLPSFFFQHRNQLYQTLPSFTEFSCLRVGSTASYQVLPN